MSMQILNANAVYTGGNIYCYNGRLEDGSFFMASDTFEDELIMILDADPEGAGEDAYQQEWQEEHLKRELIDGEAKAFWNEMLRFIMRTRDDVFRMDMEVRLTDGKTDFGNDNDGGIDLYSPNEEEEDDNEEEKDEAVPEEEGVMAAETSAEEMFEDLPDKERFLALLRKTKREGMEDLIEWIESTDFFTAPASTRFHLASEGGLCRHSLNVYEEMKRLMKAYPEIDVPEDSAIIITLLHDLCKANFYGVEMRNAKDETGTWVKVPYYTVQEQLVFGLHGGKSMYLVMKHIRLTDAEAISITNHMGGFAESPQNASNAYGKCPMAWLLHVADESASVIRETE